MIFLGISGRTKHDVTLGFLIREGDSGKHVGSKIDDQNENSWKREREPDQNEGNKRRDLRDVGSKRVGDRLLHVVENQPALLHTADNGSKVVVEDDHVGRLLGHIRSGNSHGHTDVPLLEGGRVVHTVAGDGHDLVETLAVLHDDQLLLRRGTGKHDLFVGKHAIPVGLDQILDLPPRHHDGAALGGINILDGDAAGLCKVLAGGVGDDLHLLGDGLGSVGVITRDHNDLNPGLLAGAHGVRHGLTGRIQQRSKADEGQALEREVGVVGVELVVLVVLALELVLGKGQDALAALHEGLEVLGDHFVVSGGHPTLLSVLKDHGAALDDALGGALHEQNEAARVVAVLVDGDHELVGGVEGDPRHLRALGALLHDGGELLGPLEDAGFGGVTHDGALVDGPVRVLGELGLVELGLGAVAGAQEEGLEGGVIKVEGLLGGGGLGGFYAAVVHQMKNSHAILG
mmetsp:Transcript_16292/g.43674  ORF Transcript_16292/g.43674 Transcript_16292/m.43674 type:complete len:459 (+) Transcript_16292:1121-2497(+)